MRIDGLSVPHQTELKGDVCIIGGGVTGLLLAERLAALSLDIYLLESGNEQASTAATSDALHYESSGSALEPTALNRARALGGTAQIWNTFLENRPAARYFRMEQLDFEEREGLPNGGWPFGVNELSSYYAAAEARLMPGFSLDEQQRLESSHHLPFDPARLTVVAEPFGFAELFTRHLPQIVASKGRVRVLKNATVTQIRANPAGTCAERVLVSSRPGQTFSVAARAVVLAAGTIENARLLLASNATQPNGLGNDNDVVGRYFMDHQRLNAGRLVPFDRSLFDRAAFFDLRAVRGRFWMGKLKLPAQLLREHKLLNSSTLLWPRPSARDDRGVDALKELTQLLRRGKLGDEARNRALEVMAAGRYLFSTGPELAFYQRTLAPNITRGEWSRLRHNSRRFEYFELVQQVEQAPDAENRVSLSAKTDSYGVRLPRIHARFVEADIESARVSQQLLAQELERSGVGRVVLDPDAGFPDLHQTGGIHHNLGGTRMHDDPKRGVVDRNGRVHGFANLFVTGGSVFPTGGYSNPTLTMAALALRLGAHLSECVQQLPPVVANNPNEAG